MARSSVQVGKRRTIMSDFTIIIPARYGSSRLPGKPLVPIAGKPLIVWVLERAQLLAPKDKIVVATDDQRVAGAVENAGFRAQITPKDLTSGSDRVGWVAQKLSDDIIVNLQGDEPLIDTGAVHRAIRLMEEEPDMMAATLAFPLQEETEWRNPNVVKVLTDEKSNAIYFSRAAIPFFRDALFQSLPNLYKHQGIYLYRREFLLQFIGWTPSALENAEKLEQLRVLSHGYSLRVVPADEPSYGVDTAEDVSRITEIFKMKGMI